MSLRLVLVDDHVVFLEALSAALSLEGDLAVVGRARDARSAYQIIEEQKPDVVVLDITLEGLSGISIAREIRKRFRRTKILMLTMHTAATSVSSAFAAGATGYACKDSPMDEVVRAIRMVGAGHKYLAPQLGEVDGGNGGGLEGEVAKLSAREKDVFDLAVNGYSNREIAKHLCISIKTVETHRAAVNRKLGVHSAADLVRFAAKHGFLLGRPGGP